MVDARTKELLDKLANKQATVKQLLFDAAQAMRAADFLYAALRKHLENTPRKGVSHD